MGYWKLLALPVLIAAVLIVPSSAGAQISVNIGPEPIACMAIMTLPRTIAPPMATMGPSGSPATCSSEPAHGSTVLMTFTAILITASIHIAATLAHVRIVETSPSITFTETRCVMGEATQGVRASDGNRLNLSARTGAT